MTEASTRDVTVNGVRLHGTPRGEEPLVLLCRGWQELGYSRRCQLLWRCQLPSLADAG